MDHPTKKNEKVSAGEETKTEFGTGQQQQLMKKEALMNMIAQEMITSLLGGATNDDDDDGDGDGDGDDHEISKKDEKRLEELQRKLMQRQKSARRASSAKEKKRSSMSSKTSSSTPNNQKGDSQVTTRRKSSSRASTNSTTSSTTPRSSIHKATTTLGKMDDDVVVNDDDDDDSFAGGCLDDLVDRPPQKQKQHRTTSNEGRNSASGRSSTAGGGRSVEETTSRTSSKELSIDEIRQYVLDNIPPAVREQIPEDAWEQIFGSGHQSNSKGTSKSSKQSSAANKSKNSKSSSKNSESPIEEIVIGTDGDGNNATLDDDEISMFSDVSGLTSAFPDGKTVESRRESMGGHSSVKPSLHTIPQSAQEEDGSKSRGDSTTKGGSIGAHSARSSAQYSRNSRNNSIMGKNDGEEEEKQSESATAENSLYNERLTAIAAAATNITTTNNNLSTGIKEVRFGDIEVRYYQRIVTDNPAVQSGPAIGIGWRFKRGGIVSIDYWEQGKPMKRKSSELILPRHVRESILREAGYTQKEVADMVRRTLKLKNQRKQTVNNLPAAGLEEAVEKATRRVTRLLSFGRKKDLIK